MPEPHRMSMNELALRIIDVPRDPIVDPLLSPTAARIMTVFAIRIRDGEGLPTMSYLAGLASGDERAVMEALVQLGARGYIVVDGPTWTLNAWPDEDDGDD